MAKKFSILIKEIRSSHGEIMSDMAKWLGVSLPFVSAVENGKKKIPDDWFEKISSHYSLSEEEKKELEESIQDAMQQIKINLTLAGEPKRRMALQFQRSFENIDDEKADMIYQILGGKE